MKAVPVRSLVAAAAATVLVVPAMAALPPLAAPAQAAPPAGYNLVWQDEFNGTSVDTTKWNLHHLPGGPSVISHTRPENVRVSGGNAIIDLKKENYQGFSYTGGGLVSKPQFRYGYYETRAKINDASGWHPSFWVMASDGTPARTHPRYTEIDGFEFNTNDRTRASHCIFQWNGSFTTPAWSNCSGYQPIGFDASAGFHVYGFAWDEAGVDFYIDGVHRRHVNNPPGGSNQHDYLNIILTGVAYTPAGPMDDSALPGEVQFDYVRYYQKPLATGTAGVFKNTATGVSGLAYAGSSSWTNYSVEAEIKAYEPGPAKASGVLARYDPATGRYYWLRLHSSGNVELYRRGLDNNTTLLASTPLPGGVSANTWYTLEFTVSGSTTVSLTGSVNGVQRVTYADSSANRLQSGRIGVRSYEQSFGVDQVSVTGGATFFDDFEDGNATGWTTTAGTWSVGPDGVPFFDDFEDGNGTGWTTTAGTWSVGPDATDAFKHTATGVSGLAHAGNTGWTDYSVEAGITMYEVGSLQATGILARYDPGTDRYYWLRLHTSGDVELYRRGLDNTTTLLASAPLPEPMVERLATLGWFALKLTVSGSTSVSLTGYVNGIQRVSYTDSSANRLQSGRIGVRSYEQSFGVDDVTVRPA